MQLLTHTDIQPLQPQLAHSHRLMVMGSCFATHIGNRLKQLKWNAEVNPFGVLYNPLSIAQALKMLVHHHSFTEKDLMLFPSEGWNTWMHHSSLSCPESSEALTLINTSMEQAAQALHKTDTLIITLGTAWVYRLRDTGYTVGNCHKMPEHLFIRQRLTIEEIVNEYTTLLQSLWSINPQLRIILTVSPVRHLKDTLHGNQLSKSTLLLAVDELCRKFHEKLYYFPAYEIVIDELRDYRFYADDMAHPSSQAVEYVWERFVEHCVAPEAQAFITQWNKIVKALEHRPFRPDSSQYHSFIQQTLATINKLKDKFPHIEVEREICLCNTLLHT